MCMSLAVSVWSKNKWLFYQLICLHYVFLGWSFVNEPRWPRRLSSGEPVDADIRAAGWHLILLELDTTSIGTSYFHILKTVRLTPSQILVPIHFAGENSDRNLVIGNAGHAVSSSSHTFDLPFRQQLSTTARTKKRKLVFVAFCSNSCLYLQNLFFLAAIVYMY